MPPAGRFEVRERLRAGFEAVLRLAVPVLLEVALGGRRDAEDAAGAALAAAVVQAERELDLPPEPTSASQGLRGADAQCRVVERRPEPVADEGAGREQRNPVAPRS
ncbi:hypothetical protein [Streptomyces sp. NPDC001070]